MRQLPWMGRPMTANWLDLRGMGGSLDIVGGSLGTGKGTTSKAQIPFAKVRPLGKWQGIPLKANLKVYEKNHCSARRRPYGCA